jgi:hypothetical protein
VIGSQRFRAHQTEREDALHVRKNQKGEELHLNDGRKFSRPDGKQFQNYRCSVSREPEK